MTTSSTAMRPWLRKTPFNDVVLSTLHASSLSRRFQRRPKSACDASTVGAVAGSAEEPSRLQSCHAVLWASRSSGPVKEASATSAASSVSSFPAMRRQSAMPRSDGVDSNGPLCKGSSPSSAGPTRHPTAAETGRLTPYRGALGLGFVNLYPCRPTRSIRPRLRSS